MKDKCLVLGADGFIGSHLVEALLQRNFDVRIFGRFENNKFKNLEHVKNKLEICVGDFNNKNDILKAIKEIDYVFHFISYSNPASTSNNPLKEIEMNLLPTIYLLDLCIQHSIKKIIFPSSGGAIYGDSKKKKISEDTRLLPITPYAINKQTIEQYLYYYFSQKGLDYVVYRIANVYGERQIPKSGQGVIPTIISNTLQHQKVPIYGNTIRDYVYVKDVTDFIAENFNKKQRHKIYNVGSGRGVRLSKLIKIIENQISLKVNTQQLGNRTFDIERVILDISRINNEFLFKPTVDLSIGIKKTYTYIKQKGEK